MLWRRWAAITLSVFVCLLSVACGETTPAASHPPPPSYFVWDYVASGAATTPQEAYARSAHLAPCRMPNDRMTSSSDQSVTWLLSGPDVGVIYLRATCHGAVHGDYLYRYLLVLSKGIYHRWYIDGPEESWPFPPTEYPTPMSNGLLPSPAGLLPGDFYFASGAWRHDLGISAAGRNWVALTPRDYILGLVKESVIRPQDALTTTVDGLLGWVAEANGMATVVALRPHGVVFFFAGTGSASEIETLAARVLPKAEDALGGPLPDPTPIITPMTARGV
jgi:hypothetical protein